MEILDRLSMAAHMVITMELGLSSIERKYMICWYVGYMVNDSVLKVTAGIPRNPDNVLL